MFWIGQTLNSSDPRVAEAMSTGERRWLESVARRQAQAGVHAIDVHAGTFGDDEIPILRAILPWIEAASNRRICVDSARLEVLLEVAEGRHHRPILNSLELGLEWPAQLASLGATGCDIVVQLRRGGQLPEGAEDRLAWTEEALERLDVLGVSRERVFIDPVLLAWGDDLQAGRGLLDFVADATRRWPRLRTLVGLGNVSYGHPGRGELHRRWLMELQSRGLRAAIVDPFDSELLRAVS